MEMITQQPSRLIRSNDERTITYGQRDVDAIRQQIEQTESSKRRGLLWALALSIAALLGSIAWLSTNYALYASSESDKRKLTQENAALRLRADQTQQQLDAANAELARHSQHRADAQAKLEKILPDVLRGNASPGEMASFAQMVHSESSGRLELDQKPPDKLFRNWRATGGESPGTYALVGGFVDGKWVVYSNLLSRRSTS
jgi:cell division protein FtsB